MEDKKAIGLILGSNICKRELKPENNPFADDLGGLLNVGFKRARECFVQESILSCNTKEFFRFKPALTLSNLPNKRIAMLLTCIKFTFNHANRKISVIQMRWIR